MNVACAVQDDRLIVRQSEPRGIRQITTAPWPGFPSDMVSLVSVLATQATGRTLIHDWMYELRLFALEQLSGMGADLFLCDPHRMIVNGPAKLKGRHLDTRDLRSGMALIAAALAASGVSRVGPLGTVETGLQQSCPPSQDSWGAGRGRARLVWGCCPKNRWAPVQRSNGSSETTSTLSGMVNSNTESAGS